MAASATLGLHLHDREFRCCLHYWLGVALHTLVQNADALLDNQVSCGGNRDRIAQHNAVRDVIYAAAQSVALALSKETPGLVPGSKVHPGDIFSRASVVPLLSMCSSSAHCRCSPSRRQPKHLAMFSKSGCKGQPLHLSLLRDRFR